MIGFAKEQRPFVFKGKHAMKYYEKNWQLKWSNQFSTHMPWQTIAPSMAPDKAILSQLSITKLCMYKYKETLDKVSFLWGLSDFDFYTKISNNH